MLCAQIEIINHRLHQCHIASVQQEERQREGGGEGGGGGAAEAQLIRPSG